MNDPKDPERAETELPDEGNHPSVEDERFTEMPVSDPGKPGPPDIEEFPGKDDEPEPIAIRPCTGLNDACNLQSGASLRALALAA